MSELLDPVGAYDAAFTAGRAALVRVGEPDSDFGVHTWSAEPDAVDLALFVEPCDAPTLDVGCGPGRLVGELSARGVTSLGIDVSEEAVRQTRGRGADALRLDVFDRVPGEGSWQWALLADGNLGIGGDPVRLLARVSDLLAPGGRVIVEVAAPGTGIRHEQRRLRIDDDLSEPFPWSVVGLDAIDSVARVAGLHRVHQEHAFGRHAVTLVRLAA